MTLRRALVAQGFAEARTLTLIGEKLPGLAFTQTAPENLRRVKNPMNDDQVMLRPTLLPGLLQALARQRPRGRENDPPLRNRSRLFRARAGGIRTRSRSCSAGRRASASWRAGEGSEADLFHLKGIVAAVLGAETDIRARAKIPRSRSRSSSESAASRSASPASSGRRMRARSMPRRRCFSPRSISARCRAAAAAQKISRDPALPRDRARHRAARAARPCARGNRLGFAGGQRAAARRAWSCSMSSPIRPARRCPPTKSRWHIR